MGVRFIVYIVMTIWLNKASITVTTVTNESIFYHRYIVSIHVNEILFCAGSLVSQLYVVTAAHPLIGIQAASMEVHATASFTNNGGSFHNVSEVHIHAEFNRAKFENDISLVKIIGPIMFDSPADYILFTNPDLAITENTNLKVLGFGKFEDSYRLQSRTVKVMIGQICGDIEISQKQFCAENANTTDFIAAGGPVLYKKRMIGITSHPSPGHPAIYTKVSEYMAFINDKIHS